MEKPRLRKPHVWFRTVCLRCGTEMSHQFVSIPAYVPAKANDLNLTVTTRVDPCSECIRRAVQKLTNYRRKRMIAGGH